MSWRDDARCRGMNPADFYPDKGDKPALERAKAVSAGCPVRVECLDYAITARETDGIWGGVTGSSLRRYRRQRGLTAIQPRDCAECGVAFTPEKSSREMLCSARCRSFYRRRYQRERLSTGAMLENGHGTNWRYKSGCRCPACRRAASEYMRRYRARLRRSA